MAAEVLLTLAICVAMATGFVLLQSSPPLKRRQEGRQRQVRAAALLYLRSGYSTELASAAFHLSVDSMNQMKADDAWLADSLLRVHVLERTIETLPATAERERLMERLDEAASELGRFQGLLEEGHFTSGKPAISNRLTHLERAVAAETDEIAAQETERQALDAAMSSARELLRRWTEIASFPKGRATPSVSKCVSRACSAQAALSSVISTVDSRSGDILSVLGDWEDVPDIAQLHRAAADDSERLSATQREACALSTRWAEIAERVEATDSRDYADVSEACACALTGLSQVIADIAEIETSECTAYEASLQLIAHYRDIPDLQRLEVERGLLRDHLAYDLLPRERARLASIRRRAEALIDYKSPLMDEAPGLLAHLESTLETGLGGETREDAQRLVRTLDELEGDVDRRPIQDLADEIAMIITQTGRVSAEALESTASRTLFQRALRAAYLEHRGHKPWVLLNDEIVAPQSGRSRKSWPRELGLYLGRVPTPDSRERFVRKRIRNLMDAWGYVAESMLAAEATTADAPLRWLQEYLRHEATRGQRLVLQGGILRGQSPNGTSRPTPQLRAGDRCTHKSLKLGVLIVVRVDEDGTNCLVQREDNGSRRKVHTDNLIPLKT